MYSLPPAATNDMSPAPNPSPKRKRSDSADPAVTAALSSFAPRLNTSVSSIAQNSILSSSSISPPNSPRSIVAAQLSDLKIRELKAKLPVLEFGVSDQTSKRIKRTVAFEDINPHDTLLGAITEVPETPQPQQVGQSPNTSASTREGPFPSTSQSASRKTSPPPALLSDLVWKESEITGYTIADPDDDGTGINGIGFKPTPAIAYAREQRRKQQVHEWKLREAREARQKRSERRRGASTAKEKKTVEGTVRRMVRFADALKS